MRLPSPAARALATARTASATSASLGGTASLRSGFMVPLHTKRSIRSTVRISLRKSKACRAPQAKSDFPFRGPRPKFKGGGAGKTHRASNCAPLWVPLSLAHTLRASLARPVRALRRPAGLTHLGFTKTRYILGQVGVRVVVEDEVDVVELLHELLCARAGLAREVERGARRQDARRAARLLELPERQRCHVVAERVDVERRVLARLVVAHQGGRRRRRGAPVQVGVLGAAGVLGEDAVEVGEGVARAAGLVDGAQAGGDALLELADAIEAAAHGLRPRGLRQRVHADLVVGVVVGRQQLGHAHVVQHLEPGLEARALHVLAETEFGADGGVLRVHRGRGATARHLRLDVVQVGLHRARVRVGDELEVQARLDGGLRRRVRLVLRLAGGGRGRRGDAGGGGGGGVAQHERRDAVLLGQHSEALRVCELTALLRRRVGTLDDHRARGTDRPADGDAVRRVVEQREAVAQVRQVRREVERGRVAVHPEVARVDLADERLGRRVEDGGVDGAAAALARVGRVERRVDRAALELGHELREVGLQRLGAHAVRALAVAAAAVAVNVHPLR
eukprot:scaffold130455_cov69-Phaeocystis_antarctica.AAC.8